MNRIVVPAGARRTISLESASREKREIRIGKGAELRLFEVQNLGNTGHKLHIKVRLAKGAKLQWRIATLGSARSESEREIILAGRGAEVEVAEAVLGRQAQEFFSNYSLTHQAPGTKSRLLLKAALCGSSKLEARAIARIMPGAKESNAFLEERALLLSPQASCEAVPSLEIENNEVKCSHAASVTRMDSEQLFYLQSRGLGLREARETLAMGFLAEALKTANSEWLQRAEKLARARWTCCGVERG